MEDFLNGTLLPTRRSGPPDSNWTRGVVKEEVWDSLSQRAEGDAARLVLFYRPWDRSRDKDKAVLDRVAAALADMEGVVVAQYDAMKNHMDRTAFPLRLGLKPGSVQVFLLQGAAPPEEFTGPVAQKELFQFLAKRVPTVKAGWDAKVKPRLKAIKQEEAARRKAEEEARAAAKAKEEAEEKEIAQKLKTAPKIKLSRDGKTHKQILREGEGPHPQQGDQVQAHYTGTLLNGTTCPPRPDPKSILCLKSSSVLRARILFSKRAGAAAAQVRLLA